MENEKRRQVVEIIRGIPYRRPGQLAEELQVSKKTILVRRIELEEEKERYGQTAVIEDEKTILINMYAFLDYMKYRKLLKDKVTRKYVPPYDANAWAEACTYGKKVYVEQME